MDSTNLELTNRVSYEDAANARRYGTVVEAVESAWAAKYLGCQMVEWRVRWDDGTETVSDMRQRGWRSER